MIFTEKDDTHYYAIIKLWKRLMSPMFKAEWFDANIYSGAGVDQWCDQWIRGEFDEPVER